MFLPSLALCDFLFDHNISQAIDCPTHVKGDILDLILTNNHNLLDSASIFFKQIYVFVETLCYVQYNVIALLSFVIALKLSDKDQLEQFHTHLNKQHPQIQFTREEENNQISFLDVLVRRDKESQDHSTCI